MGRIALPSGTAAELVSGGGDGEFGIVLVTDVGGFRPLFDDLVSRLSAENGWPVVGVEPFHGRQFPDSGFEARFAAMPETDDAGVLGDLVDAAAILGTARTACIGFCMGGMYALKAAGTGAFDRVCAFYGMIRVPEAWRGPGQGEPLDHIARAPVATRVMAVVGGKDSYTPPDDIAALQAAGAEVAFYPDAEHGFVHDPFRPTHRPADAADAWQRALAFVTSTNGPACGSGP